MSHASYSQMDTYMRCSKRYELSRIAKAPSYPTAWAFAGRALHAAIEEINRRHWLANRSEKETE